MNGEGTRPPDPLGLEVTVRSAGPVIATFDVRLDGATLGVVTGSRALGWTATTTEQEPARHAAGHLQSYSSRQQAVRALLPRGSATSPRWHHPHVHRGSERCWQWDCPCGAGTHSCFTALTSQHRALVAGLVHLTTEAGA